MHLSAKIHKRMIVLIMSLGIHSIAQADTSITTVGRYLSVQNQAQTAQADLLQQTFQVRFPAHVKTVGDAMHYLLQFSGYALVDDKNLPMAAKAVLSQSLPQVDRCLGPINLRDGLLTLAGKPFGLVVDPVHRLMSFRLKPEFNPIYNHTAL